MPAGPMTDTSRTRRSRAVAWNRSLSRRISSSRPTNGRLQALRAVAAARLRHDAQRAPRGDRRRLALEHLLAGRLERDGARGGAQGRLAHEHRARRAPPTGAATAVLTRSPATIPWLVAPMVTAASPGQHAGARRDVGPSARTASTSSSAARTARSASSSRAVGRAPDRHHRVADELLHRAAVARDDLPREVEVARQQLADVLRVALRPRTA